VQDYSTERILRNYVIGEVDNGSTEDIAAVSIEESAQLSHDISTGTVTTSIDRIPFGIKFAAHILERERQRQGVFMIHGNVISLGERAVACIGGISGIGKTSLSVAAQERGWEWTSDEKFLMNSRGQYIQGLATTLDDDKTRKVVGQAVPRSPKEPRDIAAFVLPISADQDGLVSHLYDEPKAVYHLYEEMGRNITASRGIMQGYDTPLPSVDAPEIAARRYACATELGRQVPMYFMLGKTEAILNRLETEIS
jgi:hypothetical protein